MAKVYVKKVKEEEEYGCKGCYFNCDGDDACCGCTAPDDARFVDKKTGGLICYPEKIIFKKVEKKSWLSISVDQKFIDSIPKYLDSKYLDSLLSCPYAYPSEKIIDIPIRDTEYKCEFLGEQEKDND